MLFAVDRLTPTPNSLNRIAWCDWIQRIGWSTCRWPLWWLHPNYFWVIHHLSKSPSKYTRNAHLHVVFDSSGEYWSWSSSNMNLDRGDNIYKLQYTLCIPTPLEQKHPKSCDNLLAQSQGAHAKKKTTEHTLHTRTRQKSCTHWVELVLVIGTSAHQAPKAFPLIADDLKSHRFSSHAIPS